MFEEKDIVGKKVALLEVVSEYTSKKLSGEICEVVRVKGYDEVDDWCQHYIVKGADGTEKEIREVDCVYPPHDELKEDYRIHKFLNENGVYADVCNFNGTSAIVVSIYWGDWKHQHLWAENLMGYLGYKEIGCKVTDENGSDCYSADHYYLKNV